MHDREGEKQRGEQGEQKKKEGTSKRVSSSGMSQNM